MFPISIFRKQMAGIDIGLEGVAGSPFSVFLPAAD